jgi:2-methylisocitrate lyase-like PEP mutase family enzyme
VTEKVSTEHVRSRAETFRRLYLGTDAIISTKAWDHASTAMIVKAVSPAIATTSAGIALAQGIPDGERLGAVWLRQHL